MSELAREYKDRLTEKESDVRELEEKLQETEEALKDRIIQNSTLMRLALMAKSTDNRWSSEGNANLFAHCRVATEEDRVSKIREALGGL